MDFVLYTTTGSSLHLKLLQYLKADWIKGVGWFHGFLNISKFVNGPNSLETRFLWKGSKLIVTNLRDKKTILCQSSGHHFRFRHASKRNEAMNWTGKIMINKQFVCDPTGVLLKFRKPIDGSILGTTSCIHNRPRKTFTGEDFPMIK